MGVNKIYEENNITVDTLAQWYCEKNGICIWRNVINFEGLYQVSSTGEVRSLHKGGNGKNGKTLKQQINKDGYYIVTLCKDGKNENYRVNRIVAEAFIPNPDNLPVVNHKDENKANNSVFNLEWCSIGYNVNYGTRNARISKQVYQYTRDGKLLNKFDSIMDVERKTGYGRSHIGECCLGKRKTCKGFIWKYE